MPSASERKLTQSDSKKLGTYVFGTIDHEELSIADGAQHTNEKLRVLRVRRYAACLTRYDETESSKAIFKPDCAPDGRFLFFLGIQLLE